MPPASTTPVSSPASTPAPPTPIERSLSAQSREGTHYIEPARNGEVVHEADLHVREEWGYSSRRVLGTDTQIAEAQEQANDAASRQAIFELAAATAGVGAGRANFSGLNGGGGMRSPISIVPLREGDLPGEAKQIYARLAAAMTESAQYEGQIIAAKNTTVGLTQATIRGQTRTVVTVTNERAWNLLRQGAVELHPSIEIGPFVRNAHAEVQGSLHLYGEGATGGASAASRPNCGRSCIPSFSAVPEWRLLNPDPAYEYPLR